MNQISQMPILVRREFWEHRTTFVILPGIVVAFFMLLMLLVFTSSTTDMIDVTLDWDDEEHHWVDERVEADDAVAYVLHQLDRISPDERVRYAKAALYASSSPLFLMLWFVVFFYLLFSLYDDRRDRSILFWKSLPVSDGMTVLSKLLTGLVVVPLVYLAGVMVMHVFGLLLLSLGALGTEVQVWETLWEPASVITNWLQFMVLMLFFAAWALPFYGWLLAVSAYAKSVPLAWAVGLPIALVIVERILTDQTALGDWMGQHMVPFGFMDEDMQVLRHLSDYVFSLDMLSALVVGAALVFLAIWLRGKADEL